MIRYFFPILFVRLFLLADTAIAQQTRLIIQVTDTGSPAENVLILTRNRYPCCSNSTTDQRLTPTSGSSCLISGNKGTFAAAADSISITDTALYAWIHRGPVYQWARLSFDKIPVALLNDMNISARDWEKQLIGPGRMAALSERILKYCEDNGYPFCLYCPENIVRKEEGLYAEMVLERGKLIKYDSVIIETDVDVSREFLQNYDGIKQGDLYNESQLRLISKRLSELPFLQEAKPWQMELIAGNKLHLFLKEKKANQLNGLIGLQPNTVETGTSADSNT